MAVSNLSKLVIHESPFSLKVERDKVMFVVNKKHHEKLAQNVNPSRFYVESSRQVLLLVHRAQEKICFYRVGKKTPYDIA